MQYNHKKEAPRKGFQWVYHAPLIKTVLFDHQRGRSAEFPKDMLKEYQGALQTDGYAGYEKIVARDGMLGLACMAHARRNLRRHWTTTRCVANMPWARSGNSTR